MSNTPVKIFVSHITEEAEVAALLKQALEDDFADAIELFASSDVGSINTSDDWLQAIQLAMSEAAAVIVLCSRASVDRPWVQFEVGAAWMSKVPIIPVCHSGLRLEDLEAPLSRLQGLELGSEAGIKRLYLAVGRLLNLRRAREPKDLAALLARIRAIEQVQGRARVEQFERYFDVTIAADALGAETVPDGAEISSDEASLKLFGFTVGVPRTWRDIVSAANKRSDTRWVRQLQRCIQLAGANEVFRPVQAVYHTETASFQPQLARKEVLRDGATRFHVHLIETVVAPLSDVPTDIGSLTTLLRLGLRFRYEVIERFRRLEAAGGPAAAKREIPESSLRQLRDAIEIIETDARSRGAEQIEIDAVSALFDSADDQNEMFELNTDWMAARAVLFRTDPAPSAGEVCEVVRRMRRINYRFMKIGTARFNDMVRTRWGDGGSAATTGAAPCLEAMA